MSYWVNLSKRWGLAWLLQKISWGQNPREIPMSKPASLRKTLSFPTLLLIFTLYYQKVSILALLKCIDGLELTFLKFIDGSVLALLNPYWPSWTRIGPPESVLALLNLYWASLIRIGPPEMHKWKILKYPVYYARKAHFFFFKWLLPMHFSLVVS